MTCSNVRRRPGDGVAAAAAALTRRRTTRSFMPSWSKCLDSLGAPGSCSRRRATHRSPCAEPRRSWEIGEAMCFEIRRGLDARVSGIAEGCCCS